MCNSTPQPRPSPFDTFLQSGPNMGYRNIAIFGKAILIHFQHFTFQSACPVVVLKNWKANFRLNRDNQSFWGHWFLSSPYGFLSCVQIVQNAVSVMLTWFLKALKRMHRCTRARKRRRTDARTHGRTDVSVSMFIEWYTHDCAFISPSVLFVLLFQYAIYLNACKVFVSYRK